MNIGLNGQRILINNPAGPERFTINLYRSLAIVDTANRYTIYLSAEPAGFEIEEIFKLNKNFSYKVLSSKYFWTQRALATELRRNPPDVFFSPVHTLPFIRSRKTKFIAMIHGLEYKSNKNFSTVSLNKIEHSLLLRWVVNATDCLIVPSQATKNALADSGWCRDINKIKIISEGVAKTFKKYPLADVKKVCSKYALTPDNYLLFISTIQPRKNIPNMVWGFSKALTQDHSLKKHQLVLVGKPGWNYAESYEAPAKYAVEQNVKFLNWVSQEDIPYLLSGAKLYINTSVEEGFGLTVLEAMACEIPVIASDIPPYRELGTNLIEYVDPKDPTDIAEKISLLLSHPYDQKTLSEARSRSAHYSWENTAKNLISVIESVHPH